MNRSAAQKHLTEAKITVALYRDVQASVHSKVSQVPAFDRHVALVWVIVSAVLSWTGLLLCIRRFSLRLLMAGAFLVGLCGMIPLKYTAPAGTRAQIRVSLPTAMEKKSNRQTDALHKLLQPAQALEWLPTTARGFIRDHEGDNIESVEVVNDEYSIVCNITYPGAHLSVERRTVIEYYYTFFVLFAYQTARLNGVGTTNKVPILRFGGAWSNYDSLWWSTFEPELPTFTEFSLHALQD